MRRAVLAATLGALIVFSSSGLADYYPAGTWGGTLPVSMQAEVLDRSCRPWDECPELEGLVYVNLNISEEMDEIHEAMKDHEDGYEVSATLRDLGWAYWLTSWTLCEYDENQTLIRCHGTDAGDWLSDFLSVTVTKDTDHLRVILETNPGATYHLKLTGVHA